MAWRIVRFEPTPNPNAVKCVLDRPICASPRSFRAPEMGVGDPIAEALFAVPGVAVLLLGGGWLTVNKSPDASWAGVKAGVKRALASLPDDPREARPDGSGPGGLRADGIGAAEGEA